MLYVLIAWDLLIYRHIFLTIAMIYFTFRIYQHIGQEIEKNKQEHGDIELLGKAHNFGTFLFYQLPHPVDYRTISATLIPSKAALLGASHCVCIHLLVFSWEHRT